MLCRAFKEICIHINTRLFIPLYNKIRNSLNYKPMTIVNDDARIVNKLDASLTDYTRVVIYYCHMFIVQATAMSECQ